MDDSLASIPRPSQCSSRNVPGQNLHSWTASLFFSCPFLDSQRLLLYITVRSPLICIQHWLCHQRSSEGDSGTRWKSTLTPISSTSVRDLCTAIEQKDYTVYNMQTIQFTAHQVSQVFEEAYRVKSINDSLHRFCFIPQLSCRLFIIRKQY